MDIIRIPTGYIHQLDHCSDEDLAYIVKNIFKAAQGDEIEHEKSMRFGLLSSIWREAVQMENRARAKKGKEWLNQDIATLSPPKVLPKGAPKSSNIKSNQVTSSQEKSKAPTKEEMIKFFDENDYPESHALHVWNYYNDANWKDSRGKEVKSWKQKSRAVWFKDEHKKKSSAANLPTFSDM